MNKHILELAYKAGYGTRWTNTEQFDQFIEKFAKLVVLECLSYAKDGDLDFMKFMIKQNFGVEA